MALFGAQSKGRAATFSELEAGAAAVHRLCLPSIGPAGRHTIIQANEESGATTLSATSLRLLEGVTWRSAITRLLVDMTAVAQHRNCGDGGLLCACVASRLILDALQQPNTSIAGRVRGWNTALQWCVEALGQQMPSGTPAHTGNHDTPPPPLCLPIRWNSLASITAMIRAVLSPKLTVFGVAEADGERLVRLVAEGFVGALGGGVSAAPCVQVMGVSGLLPADSHCVQGLLLDTPLAPEDRAMLPLTAATAAVFTCPLDVPQQLTSLETADGRPSQQLLEVAGPSGRQPDWAPGSEHLAELEQLLGRLARLGVRVVASQRVIDPAARAACRQLGMVPLERLSARHIGPFLRLTGAAPIGSTRLLDDKLIAAHLGRLGGLRGRLVRGLARTAVEVLSDPRPPQRAAPVCTIVLGTPSDLLLEEMRRAVDASLRGLSQYLHVPLACPGGGCTEMLLARHLTTLSIQQLRPQSPEAAAAQSLASALQEVAGQLTGGLVDRAELCDCVVASTEAQSAASAGGGGELALYGWHHHAAQVAPVAQARLMPQGSNGQGSLQSQVASIEAAYLLDSLASKASALACAVDAACMLCRVCATVEES
eukprot:jgi/Tetstr1/447024/TSEL_034482.t1